MTLFDEIDRCLASGHFYAAILLSLSIPDVCAALSSDDGKTSGAAYRKWFEENIARSYPQLTASDCYLLRCGVLHQGRMGHERMQYGRIVFTLPGRRGMHGNIINDALNLDAGRFCTDLVAAGRRWLSAASETEVVARNLARLVEFHPNGMLPYAIGIPIIA